MLAGLCRLEDVLDGYPLPTMKKDCYLCFLFAAAISKALELL